MFVPAIDKITLDFFEALCGSEARMRAKCPRPQYDDDLLLKRIPNEHRPETRPRKCWFNCLAAQEAGFGEAVYGWAIWSIILDDGSPCIFSQHHAVLREASRLVDITPYLDQHGNIAPFADVLFAPDSRVPLDLERGGFPPNYVVNYKTGQSGWATSVQPCGIEWLDRYGVLCFDDEGWMNELPPQLRASVLAARQ